MFSRKSKTSLSSSFHGLNADAGLNPFQRVAWFILNFINNFTIVRVEKTKAKHFLPRISQTEVVHDGPKKTPSRALSDLFWRKIDWSAVRKELGQPHVHDAGCGSGIYYQIISEAAGGLDSYHGIDRFSHPAWEQISEESQGVSFEQVNSDKIQASIPTGSNLFVTQSAIEHFDNDLYYFQQLKQFIDKSGANTIQIHLFPSAPCMKLYLWHGIRQYTPANIAKIVNVFSAPNTYSVLYALGGKQCNRLHFSEFTLPILMDKILKYKMKSKRKYADADYIDKLYQCIVGDLQAKGMSPSFYALVIHSNFSKKIFSSMESLDGLSSLADSLSS